MKVWGADFPVRVLATVEAIAASRGQGALLVLEAQNASLERLRQAGASDERLNAWLLQAATTAENLLPDADWARTGWSRLECALAGEHDELAEVAKSLITGLLERADGKGLQWRAVLTRVFPGEPLRTLYCDPEHDLASIQCSLVAWVDPYAGDDWLEAQRYPTTTLLWQSG
jgi:hypothetical protein